MTNREQMRRNAQAMRLLSIHEMTLGPRDFAEGVLALLDELEQAERELDILDARLAITRERAKAS